MRFNLIAIANGLGSAGKAGRVNAEFISIKNSARPCSIYSENSSTAKKNSKSYNNSACKSDKVDGNLPKDVKQEPGPVKNRTFSGVLQHIETKYGGQCPHYEISELNCQSQAGNQSEEKQILGCAQYIRIKKDVNNPCYDNFNQPAQTQKLNKQIVGWAIPTNFKMSPTLQGTPPERLRPSREGGIYGDGSVSKDPALRESRARPTTFSGKHVNAVAESAVTNYHGKPQLKGEKALSLTDTSQCRVCTAHHFEIGGHSPPYVSRQPRSGSGLGRTGSVPEQNIAQTRQKSGIFTGREQKQKPISGESCATRNAEMLLSDKKSQILETTAVGEKPAPIGHGRMVTIDSEQSSPASPKKNAFSIEPVKTSTGKVSPTANEVAESMKIKDQVLLNTRLKSIESRSQPILVNRGSDSFRSGNSRSISDVSDMLALNDTQPIVSRFAQTVKVANGTSELSQDSGGASDFVRDISNQITESIHNTLRQADKQITICLNPPELGRVVIKLQQQQDQITGLLEVSKAQTQHDIEQALHQVVRSLARQLAGGVQIGRLDVQLSNQPQQQADTTGSLFQSGLLPGEGNNAGSDGAWWDYKWFSDTDPAGGISGDGLAEGGFAPDWIGDHGVGLVAMPDKNGFTSLGQQSINMLV